MNNDKQGLNKHQKLKTTGKQGPRKTWSEHACSGRVSSSCFLQDTHHVFHEGHIQKREKGIYDKERRYVVIRETDNP